VSASTFDDCEQAAPRSWSGPSRSEQANAWQRHSIAWNLSGALAVLAWLSSLAGLSNANGILVFMFVLVGFALTFVSSIAGLMELVANLQLDIAAQGQWRKRRWLGAFALSGAAVIIAVDLAQLGATTDIDFHPINTGGVATLVILSLLALAPMIRPTNVRVMTVVLIGVACVLGAGIFILWNLQYLSALDRNLVASGILLSSLSLYALAVDVRSTRLTYQPIATAVANVVQSHR
jgi:hypothetical protein